MENKQTHYIYLLRCCDGSLYTGYTNDLKQRLQKHESGKGAKYTRGRGPFELVHYEVFSSKRKAMQREYEIKRWSRGKKEDLIALKRSEI
ncbi:GIY-YIG nuclease family protein [Thalassobacillus pellis]|uniref:GIY-YIG nuclease family protein n=1 Tax=Thalassobacillus pellis TaxID=748008 RepID=UPI001962213F|nr:GIY-YIG nuclease family protein [Thalassobacillus pellis]MBM7555164.1 putative endonuclease [Thalassobacillus pellis]